MPLDQIVIRATFRPGQGWEVNMADVGTGRLEKRRQRLPGLAYLAGRGHIAIIEQDDLAAFESDRLPIGQRLLVPLPAPGPDDPQGAERLIDAETAIHARFFL